MFCRAVALAHGHSPAAIREMPLRDLELLASYAAAELRMPFVGEE